jgi:hypothetical protein
MRLCQYSQNNTCAQTASNSRSRRDISSLLSPLHEPLKTSMPDSPRHSSEPLHDRIDPEGHYTAPRPQYFIPLVLATSLHATQNCHHRTSSVDRTIFTMTKTQQTNTSRFASVTKALGSLVVLRRERLLAVLRKSWGLMKISARRASVKKRVTYYHRNTIHDIASRQSQ